MHLKNEGRKMSITIGGTTPIPTNGRETIHMNINMKAWDGDGWGTESFEYEGLESPDSAIRLFDGETEAEIPITIINDGNGLMLTDGSTDNSGNVIVTANVKGHNSVKVWAQNGKKNAWVTITVNEIYFEGGQSPVPYCGYEEGEILSANPAYGGSNYIHTSYARNQEEAAGQISGNGQFSIASNQIGYLNLESLSGVIAPDLAPPDAVGNQTISKTALSENAVIVAWREPADRGTIYYHRAESYLAESISRLSDSNTTKNTLTSGIKGYYYICDTASGTNVNQWNGSFLSRADNPYLTVTLRNEAQYLHLAATDVAGNTSATIHIPVGRQDPEVAWELTTGQIIIDPEENIYPATAAHTFYVKSDGETPFTLHYDSEMKGVATQDYQIGYSIFRSQVGVTAEEQRFIIKTPSHEIRSGTIKTTAQNLQKSQEGSPILKDDAYTVTTRTDTCRDMVTEQRFTLPESFHGKKVQVTPIAGADFKSEQIYSKWEKDVLNSIYLIGDGEAPLISGAQMLETLPLIDRRDGEITLTLTATDDLSGVKDFVAEISNTDNAIIKQYTPGSDGKIRITITQDEPIFSGDFTVTLTATDQVGNTSTKSYNTTEFSLTSEVTRILTPHEPVFKCGESGILQIITYGYAERVEVEFPAEMTALNPELNKTYHYEETPSYRHEENLQFMIPLYTPENTAFTITVKAYKGDKQLEDHPSVSVIGVEGSVLGEIRTRLR
jgi:archaellum component FlaG (FlaF/FlaG flagellin family)